MSRSLRIGLGVSLACGLMDACGFDGSGVASEDGGSGGKMTGIGTLPAPTSATEGGGTSGQVKFDLPEVETAGGGGDEGHDGGLKGCSKVDLLFVIDNSASMEDEQINLIASFPGFIATITQALETSDYHVMIVTSDDGEPLDVDKECTGENCLCTPIPTCCRDVCDNPSKTTCNGDSCQSLPIGACDFTWGAGRVFDKLGASCGFPDGRRYMVQGETDLAKTFACVADVGVFGSPSEKPMHAAIEACDGAQNAPGGCNAGFLRDDAILILTFITDEEDDNLEDDGSPGTPKDWYDALVAAKHGSADAVVVLGLLGDGNLVNGTCPIEGGAEPAPRLQSLVEMFPFGVLGSVCAPDYSPFFADAVSVIDTACEMFEPIG